MKTKLKNLFITGLAALAFTYGCTPPKNLGIVKESIVYSKAPLEATIENYGAKIQALEDVVISHVSDNRIIMFGEAHQIYRNDNDFVIKLLPKMKKQGFTYLALESERTALGGLQKSLARHISGKELSPEEKFFIEIGAPGWRDLADTAKKEGIKIVCYDANSSEADNWNKREEVAYKNLNELIFDKDPNAKVIVYCGAAHLNSKEEYSPYAADFDSNLILNKGKKHKSLAYYLKKHTYDKTLTVSLIGHRDGIESDIVLNLDKGIVEHETKK
ncbi:hypothetical protein FJZ53_04565 [Candidatus Woesearchaeota archaeon]|nr:hypothetical protein [Candidatus Woesearchaeota archaeon]